MTREKIGIALSGGVDSTVSAVLLQQQGYQVHGFFMQLPLPRIKEQTARVQAVARKLAIPLFSVDMKKHFSEQVISYFVDTYLQGSTPNPCIICNRRIQFGLLAEEMKKRGIDRMATGHYARLERFAEGRSVLRKGRDAKKDQSYFLCRLSPDQLDRLVLPLGERTKEEVYRLAAGMQLSTVHGPESQDVCFLGGGTVAAFFKTLKVPERPGDIVAADGRIIGRHRGLWRYTIGQRRGLNLPDASPWYVRELDAAGNRVIVCKRDDLLTARAVMRDVRWLAGSPSLPWHGLVQLRGRHTPSPAAVFEVNGTWFIHFAKHQRAVTPGQFAAFYQQDVLLGSGVITGREAVGEGAA